MSGARDGTGAPAADIAALAEEVGAERVVETRAAHVLLTADRAYKLKKPGADGHFDYRTPELRRAACADEVRLNAPLAGDVYLGVRPVRRTQAGGITLRPGPGAPVDFAVEMRRLPDAAMLDRMLEAGRTPPPERLAALSRRLVAFYRETAPLPADHAGWHAAFLLRTAEESRAGLADWEPELGPAATRVPARAIAALEAHRDEIVARVRAGRVVDGHGDLRPEHVCLTDPVVVFDRVEFSAAIRAVDPHAEIAVLGLECALLGAPSIGPALREDLAAAGFPPPSDGLSAAWHAARCALRARQCMDHLRDPQPRRPESWAPRALRYLAAAETAPALARADGAGRGAGAGRGDGDQ